MRRIVIWLPSTVTVVVLLFGYHTSTNKTTSGTTEAGTSGSTTSANQPGASPWSPSSGSSGTGSTKITTYTGPVAQTRWGPVQVKISVQGGRLTKVTILQHPSGNSRDAQINNYALPILINETVTAQNANIDMVSGATVTSAGYVQSLQAALDQAANHQGAIGAGPGQDHRAEPQAHIAAPQHRHGEPHDDD
ncbi:MAG TPA: FMN-binding protein [Propionibacteriaceae bacterium]|nr:FMN-binding protein [Propionibacteriaceae bacterium]